MQTWADWRNIPIFYFIYGILLGLLEDALLPFEKPQSPTIVTACGQMMSAVALCPVLFVVSGARLVCLLLAACCMTGELLLQLPSYGLLSISAAGLTVCLLHASFVTAGCI